MALVVALLIAGSAELYGAAQHAIGLAADLIRQHPALGMVTFTLVAALSAMLAFFSSAVVVPVGVLQWGWLPTLLLLWAGWLLGGAASYTIGRFLGSRVVGLLVGAERFRYYQQRVTAQAPFGAVLLFQAAVPSEIPGYVLGLAGYPFRGYLAALALAELPYAAGAVLLGAGFLRRRYGLMILLGLSGIAFTGWAFTRLHRAFGKGRQRASLGRGTMPEPGEDRGSTALAPGSPSVALGVSTTPPVPGGGRAPRIPADGGGPI